MERARSYLLATLAAVGVGVSSYASQHFYDLRSGLAGFKSFCNLGQAMNCDVVMASPYAELVGGIPLSSFAAGWFLALFFVALFTANRYWRREAVRAALGLTAFGTVMTAIYLAIMVSVIKTYCLFCLVTDAVNIIALVVVLSMKPEGFSRHKPEKAKWKTLSGVIAASLLAMVAGLKSMDVAAVDGATANERVEHILNTPAVPVASGPEFPTLGNPAAKIVIVEFSDFQCPFCRMGALTLSSVLNQFPNQVRVVFRAFPLDPTCNRSMPHALHPVACESAKAVLCAGKQGKFRPVYEEVFEEQSSLVPGKAAEIAASQGADPARLAGCMSSPEVASDISRDIEEALKLGVSSTPTFFINGHKVDGALPVPIWATLIERLEKTP